MAMAMPANDEGRRWPMGSRAVSHHAPGAGAGPGAQGKSVNNYKPDILHCECQLLRPCYIARKAQNPKALALASRLSLGWANGLPQYRTQEEERARASGVS